MLDVVPDVVATVVVFCPGAVVEVALTVPEGPGLMITRHVGTDVLVVIVVADTVVGTGVSLAVIVVLSPETIAVGLGDARVDVVTS